MEVHHHPDLHHKRKQFREYFLEFLMIFLAVTMGFLAESLREHFGDKEKEREYVSSLVQNLKFRGNDATLLQLKNSGGYGISGGIMRRTALPHMLYR
jgi:hypothetical protein